MNPIVHISSKDNPLIRRIRLVAAQARRAPEDWVVVEGVRALEEASAFSEVGSVLVSESFGRHAREHLLLECWATNRRTRVYQAPDSTVKSVSAVRSFQGAIALVRMPPRHLEEIPLLPSPLLLCACGLQDPGNLGTLIRAASAAGAALACTTPGTVSVRNPKVIRASAGTCFRTPVVESVTPERFLEFCRTRQIRIYAMAACGEATCYQTDFRAPSAILVGNEANGFIPEEWPGVPSLRIPMAEGVESLNVAAAGAIVLFEAFRQRSATQAARKEPKR
jgi:TrmH family RNA methyltransferase